MAYWLLKSEPETWSWENQTETGNEPWDGVRNFQAQKNMRAMKVGDKCFFYHSGKSRQIVGIVEVIKGPYPDPDDETGRFCLVDVAAKKPVPVPVSLADIKADERLSELALVRQSRLSVVPIDEDSWQIICAMGGL